MFQYIWYRLDVRCLKYMVGVALMFYVYNTLMLLVYVGVLCLQYIDATSICGGFYVHNT